MMSSLNFTPQRMTRTEAAAVVRFVAGSFAENIGAYGYTEAELDSLANTLTGWIDAPVRATTLDELVAALMEFPAVEYGTHPLLVVNASGTVDNTDWVLGLIEDRIREATTDALASFRELASA